MTKIRNNSAYPFDLNISVDDYIIGSDAETPEKVTKNYRVGDLVKFMGSVIGQGINDYTFSLYVDENSMVPPEGYFFSENNTVQYPDVTFFRFAKINGSGVNMGVFFAFLISQDFFNLKIRSSSNPNEFSFYAIIGITEEDSYFRAEVSLVSSPEGLVFKDKENYSLDISQETSSVGIQSVTGYSVDNTDSLNPIVKAISLLGTEEGNPVTGNVEFIDTFTPFNFNFPNDGIEYKLELDPGGFGLGFFETQDSENNGFTISKDGLTLQIENVLSKGILGNVVFDKQNDPNAFAQLGDVQEVVEELESQLENKADLVGGIIPSSQLPSSIDDVLDGTYINSTTFNNPSNVPYVPMANAIYVDINTNLTYRWTNTAYVAIGNQLALGETSSTAYRGDRGKIAYDHTLLTNNPHNTTLDQIALAGNTTNVPIGLGRVADNNSALTVQSRANDTIAFQALNHNGVKFVQMRIGTSIGIECNNYNSLPGSGTTVNYAGNTTVNILTNNQHGKTINIGSETPGLVSQIGIVPRNIVNFIDAVIPFEGTTVPEWNITRYASNINLAGLGVPAVVRNIYVNPNLSNISSVHKYIAFQSTAGGVYTNTSSPQNSAILQADSTTQGFLPPRMTEAQRIAIISPINGLIVFQTNNITGLYLYEAGAWVLLSDSNRTKSGATVVTMDGSQTVFNIPHGLGSIPVSFSISFGDASNLNFVQSQRTLTSTNITITCMDAPIAGSQTVYWQVFK